MSDVLPDTVIDYVLQTNSSITYDIVRDFATEYTPLAGLGDLEHHKVSNFVEISCSHGNLELLKYLLARPSTFSVSCFAAMAAVENGHLSCLKLIYQFYKEKINMRAWSFHPNNLACFRFLLLSGWCPKNMQAAMVAARFGLLDCLQFVLETWTEATEERWTARPAEVTKAAIIGNHLNCLKYAHEHGWPLHRDGAAKAVKHGHMECLQYFLEHGGKRTADACKAACKRGRLSLLTYVHQQGCPLTLQCMQTAAIYGQLDCLQYLHANGILFQEGLGTAALKGISIADNYLPDNNTNENLPSREGCFNCFYYLVTSGCPLPQDIYSTVARYKLPSCWECLVAVGVPMNDQAVSAAIKSEDLDALSFAHQRGSPIPADACVQAIKRKRLPILRYLHEQVRLPLPAQACELAAGLSTDECLQYVHAQGCKWGVSTFRAAAKAGSLKCLEYLNNHACPWDASVCAAALDRLGVGQLDCLLYLNVNGCPWDENTCMVAAKYGNLECLKYAYEKGCSYNANLCVHASANGSLDCLAYAHEQMSCPLSKDVAEAALRYSFYNRMNADLYYTSVNSCLMYAVEHGCPVDESIRKAYDEKKRLREDIGHDLTLNWGGYCDEARDLVDCWDEPQRSDLYEDEGDSEDFSSCLNQWW